MPNLKKIGADLGKVDRLIIDLVRVRMILAGYVGAEKARTNQPMYRKEVEEERLAAIAAHAEERGVNPDFARTLLYSLIGESCKLQAIQLQSEGSPDLEVLGGDERRHALRRNLLRLTERIAPEYDARRSERHIATRHHLKFEEELLARVTSSVSGLALDLGCATGEVTLELAKRVDHVIGYDVSQHMIYVADSKREVSKTTNVNFRHADLEEEALEDGASLIVVSLGTASDFYDLSAMLRKVEKSLVPGGKFFLSCYNAEALLYQCGFLPWQVSLEAVVNPYINCLEVVLGGETFPIFAQPYTKEEVESVLPKTLVIDESFTHPTVSSILPEDFLGGLQDLSAIAKVDEALALAGDRSGAYLVLVGRKK